MQKSGVMLVHADDALPGRHDLSNDGSDDALFPLPFRGDRCLCANLFAQTSALEQIRDKAQDRLVIMMATIFILPQAAEEQVPALAGKHQFAAELEGLKRLPEGGIALTACVQFRGGLKRLRGQRRSCFLPNSNAIRNAVAVPRPNIFENCEVVAQSCAF